MGSFILIGFTRFWVVSGRFHAVQGPRFASLWQPLAAESWPLNSDFAVSEYWYMENVSAKGLEAWKIEVVA
jgi:hypothetical protein